MPAIDRSDFIFFALPKSFIFEGAAPWTYSFRTGGPDRLEVLFNPHGDANLAKFYSKIFDLSKHLGASPDGARYTWMVRVVGPHGAARPKSIANRIALWNHGATWVAIMGFSANDGKRELDDMKTVAASVRRAPEMSAAELSKAYPGVVYLKPRAEPTGR